MRDYYIPKQEHLKWYRWNCYNKFSDDPFALITWHGWDVMLELVDGEEIELVPDNEFMSLRLMGGVKFKCAPPRIMKYVKMWLNSGMFKSVKLQDFLENIVAIEEIRGRGHPHAL